MKKKGLAKGIILILICGLILSLAGCLPASTTTAPTTKATTTAAQPSGTTATAATTAKPTATTLRKGIDIKMWSFMNPDGGTSGRDKALKQMVDSFEKKYEINVIAEPQTWSTMTAKFFTAHAAGNAPDIQWVIVDEMAVAIKLGALEPFENLFMKDWDAAMRADAQSPFFDFGVTDGKHYQMGFSRNFTGLIYREDLLTAAGYDLPFEDWEEFREAAKALTVEKDPITSMKRYGYATGFTVDSADPQIVSNMLLDAQGTMFNADGTAKWANDVGVKAIEFIRTLMKVDGSMSETNLTQSVEDIYKDFAAGKYAMINGTNVRIEKAQAECVFEPATIRFAAFPSDTKETSPSVIGGWCVGIWSGSKYKQEAGKFLEWMFLPENDKLWVEIGGQAPMMNSTAKLCVEYLANPTKKFVTDGIKCLSESGWPQPAAFTIVGWKQDTNQALQDVIVNNVDPLTALKNAEKAFNSRNGH